MVGTDKSVKPRFVFSNVLAYYNIYILKSNIISDMEGLTLGAVCARNFLGFICSVYNICDFRMVLTEVMSLALRTR